MTATTIIFREAVAEDVPAIVAMLADDRLGAGRETPGDPAYAAAFAAVLAQGGNSLLLAEQAGAIVGCLQLTLIPGLSRKGMLRAQIESVRVAGHTRGQGVGKRLIAEAIARAEAAGAGLVQLTTDLSREDARAFYESLGFEATHLGMKRTL